jgi:predicted N-acetyltransferase YhbS
MNLIYRYAVGPDVPAIFRVLRLANFHNIPSPEVPRLDLATTFVAAHEDRVVGVGGFEKISESGGKTTVLAVDPEYRRQGIGGELQKLRMQAAHALGCRTLLTECDRAETVRWYRREFGYRIVGSKKKLHEFGDPGIDEWTLIECDLTPIGSPATNA